MNQAIRDLIRSYGEASFDAGRAAEKHGDDSDDTQAAVTRRDRVEADLTAAIRECVWDAKWRAI